MNNDLMQNSMFDDFDDLNQNSMFDDFDDISSKNKKKIKFGNKKIFGSLILATIITTVAMASSFTNKSETAVDSKEVTSIESTVNEYTMDNSTEVKIEDEVIVPNITNFTATQLVNFDIEVDTSIDEYINYTKNNNIFKDFKPSKPGYYQEYASPNAYIENVLTVISPNYMQTDFVTETFGDKGTYGNLDYQVFNDHDLNGNADLGSVQSHSINEYDKNDNINASIAHDNNTKLNNFQGGFWDTIFRDGKTKDRSYVLYNGFVYELVINGQMINNPDVEKRMTIDKPTPAKFAKDNGIAYDPDNLSPEFTTAYEAYLNKILSKMVATNEDYNTGYKYQYGDQLHMLNSCFSTTRNDDKSIESIAVFKCIGVADRATIEYYGGNIEDGQGLYFNATGGNLEWDGIYLGLDGKVHQLRNVKKEDIVNYFKNKTGVIKNNGTLASLNEMSSNLRI